MDKGAQGAGIHLIDAIEQDYLERKLLEASASRHLPVVRRSRGGPPPFGMGMGIVQVFNE